MRFSLPVFCRPIVSIRLHKPVTVRTGVSIIILCLALAACDSSSNNKNSSEPPSQTINSNHLLNAVTIGVDGISNQNVTITNPDNSTSDVTLDATWISSDESVVIVLEPGLLQGVGPGTATVEVSLNGEIIQVFDFIVLATIPADITWISLSNWVVYKDGPNGPWTLLERDVVTGNYLFTVTDPNSQFAVAEVYQTAFGMNKVDIAFLKVDDLTNNTLVTNNSTLASNVTINVAGSEPTDQGFLTSYDIASSQYYWATNYDLDILPTGLYAATSDLLANIFDTDVNGNRFSLHYYRENDVIFSDGMNKTIDIRGTMSFAADIEQTVTIASLNGDEDFVYLDADFATANGSLLNIARYHVESYSQQIAAPLAMRYHGLPAVNQRAGDTYRFIAKAGYLDGVEVTSTISTAASGNYIINLPQPMLPSDFNWEFLNTGANLISRFSWNSHIDAEHGAADYYSILLRHVTQDISWNVKIDPIWLDPAAMTIDTPDFRGLPGWDSVFNISEGSAVYARLRAYHSNVSDTELLRDGLVNGVNVNQLSLNQTLFP